MGPPVNKRCRKGDNDEVEANVPPKVLRKDHAAFRPAQKCERSGTVVLCETTTIEQDVAQSSRKMAPEIPTEYVATAEVQDLLSMESLRSGKSTTVPSVDGSPGMHGLRNQAKNLETLLEAEVDMKKAAEAKNMVLAKELESLHAQFADLQVSNNQLSEQVSTL
ncbi:hypothetical protein Tco_1305672 [Tanacetum coccineum]